MREDIHNEMLSGYESGKVILRFPRDEDRDEFVEKARGSRGFHNGLVSPPLDEQAFSAYLSNCLTESDRRILVFEKERKEIAGAVNISQIFMKAFCSAYLGYYLFEGFSRRGLMTDALRGVIKYSFRGIGLHRLEANVQPENSKSIELLKRCGFSKEGFSSKYLMIGGEWRDHERWAIILEDWQKINND